MFTSHVEKTIEAAHHNGPPGNKCEHVHGHSWKIVVEFAYDASSLNEYGWGPDFGRVKAIIDALDHQDLNSVFDSLREAGYPAPPKPSAEYLAQYIWQVCYDEFGISPTLVRVHEGGGNSVEYRNDD